jgi:hypothetical protein
MHTEIQGDFKKQLLVRQKCHKNSLSFATEEEEGKSLSLP